MSEMERAYVALVGYHQNFPSRATKVDMGPNEVAMSMLYDDDDSGVW